MGPLGKEKSKKEEPKPKSSKKVKNLNDPNAIAQAVPEASCGTKMKNYLWDPKTGLCLGRTSYAWLKLTFFYILFFCLLGCVFIFLTWIFYATLSSKYPKWQGAKSIIGDNPGMGFRPKPDQELNVESSLIWYMRNDPKDSAFWSEQLREFLEVYEQTKPNGKDLIDCYAKNMKLSDKFACWVDTRRYGPCQKENNFGYDKGEPCVLIKLNKIYGWEPKAIDPEKDEKIYKKMPSELQKYIKETEEKNRTEDYIWIACDGENPSDKENIGRVHYYPEPGLPFFFFPYLRQDRYQTPFIFVQFTNPRPGTLINIECRAWAKNIKSTRATRHGIVHFELMVD